MGGQLCNLIDPATGAKFIRWIDVDRSSETLFSFSYSEVTETRLKCLFESDEVGQFDLFSLSTIDADICSSELTRHIQCQHDRHQ